MACLRDNKMDAFALTKAAALRPTFLSNLGERTVSMSWPTTRDAVEMSWSGSSRANRCKPASTTAVAAGGNSGHQFSASKVSD